MTGQMVLLTGATGFVGSAVLPVLLAEGHGVRVLGRRVAPVPTDVELRVAGDLSDEGVLARAMQGVHTVCHVAGLAHRGGRRGPGQSAFDAVNVDLSCRLANAAYDAGVVRMVFVSSIGAVGSVGRPGRPWSRQVQQWS